MRLSRSIWRPVQSLKCLTRPQIRLLHRLSREQAVQALDSQIRSLFPTTPAVEVEEVVRARRGIWGGLNGGELYLDSGNHFD